jgi:hypothetical protein
MDSKSIFLVAHAHLKENSYTIYLIRCLLALISPYILLHDGVPSFRLKQQVLLIYLLQPLQIVLLRGLVYPWLRSLQSQG